MNNNKNYISMDIADSFILCTSRKDNMWGNFVNVKQLEDDGIFENFGEKEKKRKYKFESAFMADFFFEFMGTVIDYQDRLRQCIAPIDYAHDCDNPDNVWVKRGFYIGPYITRRIRKTNEVSDFRNPIEIRGTSPLAPKTNHIVLDTFQTDKNGISYVYNLLVKPEDIESGYNPNGLATVEIAGFLSDIDAYIFSQSSRIFKSQQDGTFYDKYRENNQKRQQRFTKIVSGIENERGA